MTEREYIINKAKELGVTADEMGFAKEVETVIEKDTQFVHEVSQMIIGMDIQEEARENISEKYWEDLGIAVKKYKIVKVKMEKTIYKDIYVAIPEDEYTDNVENYIDNLDNLDNDYPDDEEDWEINDYELDEYNLTADDVYARGGEIWNYNDFED